jgi:hypothetical protein
MPQFEIDIEVYCKECRGGLCQDSEVGYTRGRCMPFVSVGLCEDCVDAVREKAYEEGRKEGYKEGYEEREKDGS